MELLHSTSQSIGIQVREAKAIAMARCFHPPNQNTESQQCLGSAIKMHGMFYGATAFNQPLVLDTSKVEDVRVFCDESNLINQILICYSYRANFQMGYMFYLAEDFNQPLSFNTTAVQNVRIICVEFNQPSNERETRF